jgi:iron(III) transport system substrate-binding protein
VDSFITAREDELLEQYITGEAKYIPDQYKDKDGCWTGISLVNPSFFV